MRFRYAGSAVDGDRHRAEIATTVRHAITLPPTAARQILAMFKRTLPRDLAVLDA